MRDHGVTYISLCSSGLRLLAVTSWPGLSRPSTSLSFFCVKSWMPGIKPGMTREGSAIMHSRFGEQKG